MSNETLSSVNSGRNMNANLFAQATPHAGAWTLADNPVWSVPADTDEVPAQVEARYPSGCLRSYRALAVDLAGRVYGMRTISRPVRNCWSHTGWVSIGGRRLRASTGETIGGPPAFRTFRRPDGSLCEVAVIVVQAS